MRKLNFKQRLNVRLRGFANTMKEKISNNFHKMLFNTATFFNKHREGAILFPVVVLLASAGIAVHGVARGIISFFSLKPKYAFDEAEVRNAIEKNLTTTDVVHIFIDKIISEYNENKTRYSSPASRSQITHLKTLQKFFVKEPANLGIGLGLFMPESSVYDKLKREYTTTSIINYLKANKSQNNGKRLFNIICKKIDSLDYIMDKKSAEDRKNTRMINQGKRCKQSYLYNLPKEVINMIYERTVDREPLKANLA